MKDTTQNIAFDLDIMELDRRLEFANGISCSSPNTCTVNDSGTVNLNTSSGSSGQNDPSAPSGASGENAWGRPSATVSVTW